MKFRPHRALLSEAMAECVEVDGLSGLLDHLRATHPSFGPAFDPASIRVEPYGGDDDRIGWKDVHIVIDQFGVAGFCEGAPAPGLRLEQGGDPRTFEQKLNDAL